MPEDVAQDPDDLNSPSRFRKLAGRIAIVTGSDSGIGRAIAEAFAMEGADVAVTFHTDQDGAQETARSVESFDRRALVRQVDVRDEASVTALFEAVEAELGPDVMPVGCTSLRAAGTSPSEKARRVAAGWSMGEESA